MEDIGKLLPAAFIRETRRAGPFLVEILTALWPRVAGKPLALQCRPAAFDAGTLTLVTECSSWAAELPRVAEAIRAEINCFLGEPVVKKLRVRYQPNLDRPEIIQTSETRDPKQKSRLGDEFRSSTFDVRSCGGEAGLDPEVARIVARSFSKYFGRSRKGAE